MQVIILICIELYPRAEMEQSVYRLATGWMTDGSEFQSQ
jgi:hypothetical protein